MSTLVPPPADPACRPARVLAPDERDVALLVARRGDGAVVHTRFTDLPDHLATGDLLVVNTSATLPAELPGVLDGRHVVVHLSTPASEGDWVIELRTAELAPVRRPPLSAIVDLPGAVTARLLAPFEGSDRLTVARLSLSEPIASSACRRVCPRIWR